MLALGAAVVVFERLGEGLTELADEGLTGFADAAGIAEVELMVLFVAALAVAPADAAAVVCGAQTRVSVSAIK